MTEAEKFVALQGTAIDQRSEAERFVSSQAAARGSGTGRWDQSPTLPETSRPAAPTSDLALTGIPAIDFPKQLVHGISKLGTGISQSLENEPGSMISNQALMAKEHSMPEGIPRQLVRFARGAVGGAQFMAQIPSMAEPFINPEAVGKSPGESAAEMGSQFGGALKKFLPGLAYEAEQIGKNVGGDPNYKAKLLRKWSNIVNAPSPTMADLKYMESHDELTPTEVQAGRESEQQPFTHFGTALIIRGAVEMGAGGVKLGVKGVKRLVEMRPMEAKEAAGDLSKIAPKEVDQATGDLADKIAKDGEAKVLEETTPPELLKTMRDDKEAFDEAVMAAAQTDDPAVVARMTDAEKIHVVTGRKYGWVSPEEGVSGASEIRSDKGGNAEGGEVAQGGKNFSGQNLQFSEKTGDIAGNEKQQVASPQGSVAGKQPWEMTRAEWRASKDYQLHGSKAVNRGVKMDELKPESFVAPTSAEQVSQIYAKGNPPTAWDKGDEPFLKNGEMYVVRGKLEDFSNEGGWQVSNKPLKVEYRVPAGQDVHKSIVEQALASGKPVPPSVLAEYPELAGKVSPPSRGAGKVEARKIPKTIAADLSATPYEKPTSIGPLWSTDIAIGKRGYEQLMAGEEPVGPFRRRIQYSPQVDLARRIGKRAVIELEPVIQKIADNMKTADGVGEIKIRAKSRESIADKLLRKHRDTGKAPMAEGLGDLAGGAIIVKDFSKFPVVLNELAKHGKIINVETSMREPMKAADLGYRGVHIDYQLPTGHTVEVQLHTPATWWVKEEVGDVMYRKYRSVNFDDIKYDSKRAAGWKIDKEKTYAKFSVIWAKEHRQSHLAGEFKPEETIRNASSSLIGRDISASEPLASLDEKVPERVSNVGPTPQSPEKTQRPPSESVKGATKPAGIGVDEGGIKTPSEDKITPVSTKVNEKIPEKVPQQQITPLDKHFAGEIKTIPLKDINVDPGRFQNRLTPFSEETAAKVAERFDPARFGALKVWEDPKGGQTYVISGHSRLEGLRRRGAETVPVKYFEGTEQEAINFARIDANRLHTKESLAESIGAYRLAKSQGYSKTRLADVFAGDVSALDNLQHLNPKGKFVEILGQETAGQFPYVKNFARWTGELRDQFGDKLTGRHENQIFNFLYKEGGKNYELKKDQFFNLISKNVDRFDWDSKQSLVLSRNQVPVVGTRARADTGVLEAKIDQLKVDRGNARTPEEVQTIDQEIAKIRVGINELVKNQTDIFARQKAGAQMPKSMEPASTKPTTINDIREHFEKSLDTPIRTGKFAGQGGPGAAAIYKSRADVIRLKDYGDIESLSHEVAHVIDSKYPIKRLYAPKDIKAELAALDYAGKGRPAEGFGEYLRHYMTGSADAEKLAPKFTQAFQDLLKKNPILRKTIEQGKQLFDSWRSQGAEARVKATMVYTPERTPLGIGIQNVKNWYLREFDDALTPLRHFTEAAEEVAGKTLRGAENPFELATAVKSAAPARARGWIDDVTTNFDGKETGPGLRTIFEGVKGNEEAAIEYAYAKHGIERWGQGKNPGSDLADLKYVVEQNKSPEFDKFSKDLSSYRDRLLQYVVDAGGLDPETATLFRETYQSSIPLYREGFETGGGGTGGGARYGDLGQPMKRAHGSGRMVINPVAGLMKETERLISFSDRVRVGAAIVEAAEKYPGLGSWAEKVNLPAKVNRISADQAVKNFGDAGIDLSTLDPKELDKVLTSWSQQVRGIPNENVVTFYKDGKLQAYQLNKDLYDGIKQVNPWAATGFFKLLAIPKKIVAAGATGFRPSFGLLTNALRDPWSAMMQSKIGKTTPVQSFGGTLRMAVHKLGLDEKVGLDPSKIELWKRVGGEQAIFFNSELPRAMENAKAIIADNQHSKAMNVVRHPVELYRQILGTPEAGPRANEFINVYDKVLKETGDHRTAWIEALNSSKNVTMNFGRAGRTGAVINQFVPFFNPTIQEPGLIIRTFNRNPMGTVAKGMAGLTIPTIALWYVNKDEDWYKATATWEKATFWHFRINDTTWRLPKPFLWGALFASWPEAILDSFDKHDPEIMKEMSLQLGSNTIPAFVPPWVSVPFAVGAGEGGYDTFRNRPIVPSSQVQNLPPAERYGNYTTETAKAIGRVLNVSPSKVDYTIGGFTGGLGTDIIQAAEKPFTGKAEKSGLANEPFIGRLVSRDPYVNKFYDESDKIIERMKELKVIPKSEWTPEDRATAHTSKHYQKVTEKFSEIRKDITKLTKNANLTPEEKGKRITALQQRMTDLAHKVLYETPRSTAPVPDEEPKQEPQSVTPVAKPDIYGLEHINQIPPDLNVDVNAIRGKTGERIKVKYNARKAVTRLNTELATLRAVQEAIRA